MPATDLDLARTLQHSLLGHGVITPAQYSHLRQDPSPAQVRASLTPWQLAQFGQHWQHLSQGLKDHGDDGPPCPPHPPRPAALQALYQPAIDAVRQQLTSPSFSPVQAIAAQLRFIQAVEDAEQAAKAAAAPAKMLDAAPQVSAAVPAEVDTQGQVISLPARHGVLLCVHAQPSAPGQQVAVQVQALIQAHAIRVHPHEALLSLSPGGLRHLRCIVGHGEQGFVLSLSLSRQRSPALGQLWAHYPVSAHEAVHRCIAQWPLLD